MKDEVHHWATAMDLSRTVKPKNWSSGRLKKWLTENPVTSVVDVGFIKEEILGLVETHLEQQAARARKPAKNNGPSWKGNEPLLRQYHCLVEYSVRVAFLN